MLQVIVALRTETGSYNYSTSPINAYDLVALRNEKGSYNTYLTFVLAFYIGPLYTYDAADDRQSLIPVALRIIQLQNDKVSYYRDLTNHALQDMLAQ